MPDLAKLSLGAVLLGKAAGAETIARALGAKLPTVYAWLNGGRVPSKAWRAKIDEGYQVAPSAWDHPAVDPPAPTKSELVAKFQAARPPAAAPSVEAPSFEPPSPAEIRAGATTLKTWIESERARVEADVMATPTDRLKALHALTGMLKHMAKFTGEASDTPASKIVRTPAWQRIMVAIRDALAPWPAAMQAVGEAVARLEDS